MAKCINHPYSNATYFHSGFTYCNLCENYFKARTEFDLIYTWDRPLMNEVSIDFDNKIIAAKQAMDDTIDKILRN